MADPSEFYEVFQQVGVTREAPLLGVFGIYAPLDFKDYFDDIIDKKLSHYGHGVHHFRFRPIVDENGCRQWYVSVN